jgi:hypothetical protein
MEKERVEKAGYVRSQPPTLSELFNPLTALFI